MLIVIILHITFQRNTSEKRMTMKCFEIHNSKHGTPTKIKN